MASLPVANVGGSSMRAPFSSLSGRLASDCASTVSRCDGSSLSGACFALFGGLMLASGSSLRAVFNVESNFLPNVDYAECHRRGIPVLSTAPVYARPVAEMVLGMALSLARRIHEEAQKISARLRQQYGILDIGVPAIRELRSELPE